MKSQQNEDVEEESVSDDFMFSTSKSKSRKRKSYPNRGNIFSALFQSRKTIIETTLARESSSSSSSSSTMGGSFPLRVESPLQVREFAFNCKRRIGNCERR